MEQAAMITPGLYRHYKGGLYIVITVAERSEEPGFLDVIYKGLDNRVFSRPLLNHTKAWLTLVDGQERFKRVV